MAAITVDRIVAVLGEIAPLSLAEGWDNVGLLVDAARRRRVDRVLLTIDLTEAVLREAVKGQASLIVAYHPPIFSPLTRLRRGKWKERLVLELARRGIAVYSPHTALDAAPGGVNDWLASGLGRGRVTPVQAREVVDPHQELKLVVFVPEASAAALRAALAEAGAGVIGDYRECSYQLAGRGTFRGLPGTSPAVGRRGRLETVDELRVEMVCPRRSLPDVQAAITAHHPYEEPAWDVYELVPRRPPGAGQGREVVLRRPVSLKTIVSRIKRHLGLRHVRLAAAARHEGGEAIERVALCAGAGASVITGCEADLLLTGEMRHHDVLDAVERGRSVVLCDHTNTERGYLPTLERTLTERLGGAVAVTIARSDADPLRVV